MNPSEFRVAARWASESLPWTLPFLQSLVEAAIADPNGWGEGSPAARTLRRLIQSASQGNVDPFPVGELWDYLADFGVDSDELAVLKRVSLPRKTKTKRGPQFQAVWQQFERETGKSTILSGIRLDDPQSDRLVATLQAVLKAVSDLPPHADRLWRSEVKKVRLRDSPRGSEDASWENGGVLSLALSKPGTKNTWKSHIVHELGHALEERIGLRVTPWDETPYGQPPFISDYAEVNASEDFAETFRAFVLEPSRLRRTAPRKFEDMAGRV